ncbi:MAG: helix-turn-helix domain-containing protein [Bacteroidales bacterium]|nr:helix-turn-helix domain-containing protein [Bacteroidales bacterium]
MVERINLILQTKNLSASDFANQIGVQRSNVSHVLSGRNRPSLDFIQKILNRFPDINSDWLLLGKGSMYEKSGVFPNVNKEEAPAKSPPPARERNLFSDQEEVESEKESKGHTKASRETAQFKEEPVSREEPREVYHTKASKEQAGIEKIVIFYADRTFKEYIPGD